MRHGCETQQMGRKKDEKSGAGMDPQVNKSENTKHGGQGALDVPIESKKAEIQQIFSSQTEKINKYLVMADIIRRKLY